MLVRYCHIDYDREIAIVAIGGKGRKKQMLGSPADDRDGQREEGEFAIWCATATSARPGSA